MRKLAAVLVFEVRISKKRPSPGETILSSAVLVPIGGIVPAVVWLNADELLRVSWIRVAVK